MPLKRTFLDLLENKDILTEGRGRPPKNRNVSVSVNTDEEQSKKDKKLASSVNLDKSLDTNIKLKYKQIPPSNNSQYLKIILNILNNMLAQAYHSNKSSILISGDPGSGKTSMVRNLANLLGIRLVVIEAPQITEEHLINIPFVIFDSTTKKEIKEVEVVDTMKMDVAYAESALLKKLLIKNIMPDEQLEKLVKTSNILSFLYEKLKTKIKQVRESYHVILFLDEYYRNSNEKIRNILRGILNGKIGNANLPKGVYVLYASNMNDEGLAEIAANEEFLQIDYNNPSKDDFFRYIKDKYVDNDIIDIDDNEIDKEQLKNVINKSNYKVRPEVFNKFYDELSDEDLGSNDIESNIRLSPRRLEQIIIYIDANLPVSSIEEAGLLLNFVRTNLRNYETLQYHKLLPKFEKIVKDLIKETSPDINVNDIKPLPSYRWRDELKHQIKTKMILKNDRRNVVTVSGIPGIGKTSMIKDLAKQLNMNCILIDTSTLNEDMVIGIGVLEKTQQGAFVNFSKPPLYDTIMKFYRNPDNPDINLSDNNLPYKHILFFTEFNRVKDPKVFNAIRFLMLEKKFSDEYPLPDDILIATDINPSDLRVISFTSHLRDVLDIIHSTPSFTETIEYLKTQKSYKVVDALLNLNISTGYIDILKYFSLRFKSDVDINAESIKDEELKPFYWNIEGNVVYISPRNMSDIIGQSITNFQSYLELEDRIDFIKLNDEEYYSKYFKLAIDAFLDATNIITFNLTKQNIDQVIIKKLNNIIKDVVMNDKEIQEIIKKMFTKVIMKSDENIVSSLPEWLKKENYNMDNIDVYEVDTLIQSYTNQESFAIDLIDFINTTMRLDFSNKHNEMTKVIAKLVDKLKELKNLSLNNLTYYEIIKGIYNIINTEDFKFNLVLSDNFSKDDIDFVNDFIELLEKELEK